MSKSDHICRNPECKARFSKADKSKSRRVPDLVDTAALNVYYAANLEKAVNRSPNRVCLVCGYERNVKPPKWLPQHLLKYACSPRLSPPLFLSAFLRRIVAMP